STAIWYSCEARPYALVQFLSVVAIGLLQEMVDAPNVVGRACLVIVGGLLFYLHFTTALLALPVLAYYCVRWRHVGSLPAYRPQSLALDAFVLVLICLPATSELLDIASRRAAWAAFLQVPDFWDLVSYFPVVTYVMIGSASVVYAQRIPIPEWFEN